MATVVYTLEEVRKRRDRDSCWIVVEGKVYDVTKYIDQHPGGDKEILNEGGTDATQAFNEVGHSSDAREILETLKIGVLHADDVRALARKNYSIPWKKITAIAAVPLCVGVLVAIVLIHRK